MGTEYSVQIGMDEEFKPMGRRVGLGKGKGTKFVWAIHPYELFTHLRVWVCDEKGGSWPLESFDQKLGHCEMDYSHIGEGF